MICIRFHLLSGYIRFTSSEDPEKKYAARCEHLSFFSYNQTCGTSFYAHHYNLQQI